MSLQNPHDSQYHIYLDMMWYEKVRYNTIRYNMIWYDMTLYIYIYVYIVMTLKALTLGSFGWHGCCAKCLVSACVKSWPYLLATKCVAKCMRQIIAFGKRKPSLRDWKCHNWHRNFKNAMLCTLPSVRPATDLRKDLSVFHNWSFISYCTNPRTTCADPNK